VGRARALRRKTKASGGVPTEAFDVFRAFAFSALAQLSARARHSRCPAEFGELSGIVYFNVQPPVTPRALNTRGTISAFRRLAVGEGIVVVQH
jgi:hypothetical protein